MSSITASRLPTSIKMQLAAIFATLMAAGASASPIEARQWPGRGSVKLYSSPRCSASNAVAKTVNITDGCTNFDEAAASVWFNGGTGFGYAWERKF